MKFFKLMMIALVAMIGLSSCSESSSSDSTCNHDLTCDHNFIEVDYSKKLAGTWTCLDAENEYAEALIFNADGSVTSTGVFEGEYYEKKGTYKIKGNKMTLSFEDGDGMESRFEMVEGEVFSLVDDELDVHFNYYYCENDLSDELVGMWVCNDGWTNDIAIQTYTNDGKSTMTTPTSIETNEPIVNKESDYKVVGDMLFRKIPAADGAGYSKYIIARMAYSPNGTALGDIMTHTVYIPSENGVVENVGSWLRIKQNLNLVNRTYDYISAYVSNAKGTDEDFTIMGHTFNISNIEASNLDMMFRSILSCIELNENSFKYTVKFEGQDIVSNDPISVEGNKVTVDMGAGYPGLRKVEMYMFQDADDCQLHIYMPTKSFINYFANLLIPTLVSEGKLDTSDTAAVEKVFADMESRIESINVSLVYKARE